MSGFLPPHIRKSLINNQYGRFWVSHVSAGAMIHLLPDNYKDDGIFIPWTCDAIYTDVDGWFSCVPDVVREQFVKEVEDYVSRRTFFISDSRTNINDRLDKYADELAEKGTN